MNLQTHPKNTEAEESLLSAFLFRADSIDENIRLLVPSDFYWSKNQIIFNAIQNLYEDGSPIDLITVKKRLESEKQLEKIGGMAHIVSITQNVPQSISVAHHVKIVKDAAKLRRLIAESNEIINKCHDPGCDSNELLSVSIDNIEKIKNDYVPELSMSMVENWIKNSPGEFGVRELDFDLNVMSQSQKTRRTKILEKMVKSGLIERAGKRRGFYRPAQKDLDEINFMDVELNPVNMWLPFNLNKAVKIFPGNIIQISGEKNAGKTGLNLNIIRGNMKKMNVHYFNSEMGGQELKLRLSLFDDIPLEVWKFKAYARSDNFSDVIFPGEGNLNIIDFLECHDEFYKMGQYMKDIHDKLKGAVAIVCIQKNKGAEKGLGGNRTEEKPRLILNVKPGTITIGMAKNWVTKENPNGKSLDFKLVNGCKLYQVGDWYKEK